MILAEATLLELAPFIEGRAFTSEALSFQRGDAEIQSTFNNMLADDAVAKQQFDQLEDYKDFFATEPDFDYYIPKAYHEECFYTAKNGAMYFEVPAKCLYLLRQCYEAVHEIPNLIFKVAPVNEMTKWFSRDYFLNGLSMKDVIKNLINPDYEPLSSSKLRNAVETPNPFTEIYITQTDMVAAVPNDIAKALNDENILNIKVLPSGLCIDKHYLRTYGNRFGAINSVYDLRDLI